MTERPTWVRPRTVHSDHECAFTVEQPIPREDLPPYVGTPVIERYCEHCGTKQTLLERLQAERAR